MKAYIFPGQGSQSKGMGGNLFDEFSELTEKADKILGYSIKELCLEDPRRELNKTQFTQPALYVVNALNYLKKVNSQIVPDFVAGHSLGEFNALLAAECFDFEAGLKLVKKRGELMGQASGGGMAAILNASKVEIEEILQKNGLHNIDLANYNTPSQIVISGSIDEIGQAQTFFQQGEMLYYPLNTSGAFHSRFMQSAQEKFENYLKKFKFSAPKIPVIANVTAQPYESDSIIDNLARQISGTVRWCESIQYLIELGEKADNSMQFDEIGNGDVLTKMVHTIKTQSPKNSAASLPSNSDQVVREHENTKPIDVASSAFKNTKVESKIKDFGGAEPAEAKEVLWKSDATDIVNNWNNRYPVGTKVKSTIANYDNLETRTKALVLFGHRAAIYMKGFNGYFDVTELTPL